MPAFIKTPKDEKKWSEAKRAASKTKNKKESEFHDQDWALVNYIYHKMHKTEAHKALAEIYKTEIIRGFHAENELSIENLRNFLCKTEAEQQSISSTRGFNMAEEKKYTAREAAIAVLKKAEEVIKKSEILNKVEPKQESEIKKSEEIPHKASEEKDASAPDKVEEQVAPDMNPKEQAEGNNKEWGTAPMTYGTLKLAKFIGHMESKRRARSKPNV